MCVPSHEPCLESLLVLLRLLNRHESYQLLLIRCISWSCWRWKREFSTAQRLLVDGKQAPATVGRERVRHGRPARLRHAREVVHGPSACAAKIGAIKSAVLAETSWVKYQKAPYLHSHDFRCLFDIENPKEKENRHFLVESL